MNILITGCGSSIGLEIAKSLKYAKLKNVKLIGTEISWWGLKFGKKYCDEVILTAKSNDPLYEKKFLNILKSKKINIVFVNTDGELEAISKFRDKIKIPISCPEKKAIEICLDKQLTYKKMKKCARLPATMEIKNSQDIKKALDKFGPPIWLRSATGAGGRGSIIIKKANHAEMWIDYWKEMGWHIENWLAHEYLPGKNYGWCSIWKDGELIISCTGERLRYLLENVTISGVTGMIAEGIIVANKDVNVEGTKVIKKLSEKVTGIFTVDFREDKNGFPLLTEINARHAFRPWCFTKARVNFAKIFVELMLEKKLPSLSKYDAGKTGVKIARTVDMEPVFQFPKEKKQSISQK